MRKRAVVCKIGLFVDLYVYKIRGGHLAQLQNKKEIVLVAGGKTDKLAIDNLWVKIKEYYVQ